MTQIRRLATIPAADVAGYLRLIGADESGTLETARGILIAEGDIFVFKVMLQMSMLLGHGQCYNKIIRWRPRCGLQCEN